jgi:hypothetical protein
MDGGRHITSVFAVALLLCTTLAAWSVEPVHPPHTPSLPPQVLPPDAATNGTVIAQRLPRVVYRGGPFLRHPRIVTITFSGDDPDVVSRLEQFGATIARTPWWRAVVAGYCAQEDDCIGEGQPGLAVRLDETLPAEVHGVEVAALLKRHAQAGRLGPLDPDTVLLVYLPQGVRLTDAFVPRYCGDGPRAFHRALRFDDKTVGYAVMPRCSDAAALTATASHELLEVTLSPDTAHRGFAFVQSSANLGFTAAGTEAMDPCGFITSETDIVESGFVVRRAWSNRAASQGHDPCVPGPTERPYLALVPQQPTVRLAQAGESVTITLAAVADRPVPPWAVSAIDLTGSQEHEQYVEVALGTSTVAPGDTTTLTVTRRKQHPKHVGIVGLVSTLETYSYLWPVAVVMR